MKNCFLMLVLALGIISCSSDGLNCNPESFNSKWNTHKSILVEYNSEYQRNHYSIVEGANRLFEYNHSGAQCEERLDDEWGEVLTFEIGEEINDFEYLDENILETKCFYWQYGAWVSHNQYEIKNGKIKGEKISENEWEITVDVTTTPQSTGEQAKVIEFVKIFSN